MCQFLGVHQNNSYICKLLFRFFSNLLQDIEYSSLCYSVGYICLMLISNQQMTNIIDNKYYWQQMELGLGLTYGVWGCETHKCEREKGKRLSGHCVF